MTTSPDPSSLPAAEIYAIDRPHSSLFTYYLLSSLLSGPLFPLVLLPLYFRYHTMRYQISPEGVSMRWGILFHKEINLTFARIQDIHLTSNFVERWLGLARIQIQTASGSAKAEMTIEGIQEYRALRDFLYARMRGAKGLPVASVPDERAAAAQPENEAHGTLDRDLVAVLDEATAELRGVRQALTMMAGNTSARVGERDRG